MRHHWERSLAILALVALALGARSVAAAPLAFTGTLTLQLFPTSEATVVVAGSGVAQVTGSPHLMSFLLSGATFGPVTTQIDLNVATGTDLLLSGVQNRNGSFSGAGGAMGLSGIARLCLVVFDASCNYVFVPLPINPTGTPQVGFGIGGTQIGTDPFGWTAQHAPWALSAPALTIHYAVTSVVTSTIPAGFIHGPASGSASSAAQPGGVVQFVTATKVSTSLTGSWPELPMWAVLNLHFVPEPGLFVLLGVGAAGVLAVARRRR